MAEIPKLKELSLVDCFPTTDGVLKKIGSLRNLQQLELEHCTSVSTSGLQELSKIESLKKVRLEGLPINLFDPSLFCLPAKEIQLAQSYTSVESYDLKNWVFLVPKMDQSDRRLLERHAMVTRRILLR